MKALVVYIIAINVVSFIMFGIDKYKARRGQWRISEATLLGVAAIGGSIGAWMGMKTWHHKTLHSKFRYGVPTMLLVHIALVAYFCGNYN
ncbi:MAG: DUF1294 domain-containing protein [Muribaculaceae bacterium]